MANESTTKTKFYSMNLNLPTGEHLAFGKCVLSSTSVMPPYAWTISPACTKTQEGELMKNTRQHRGGSIFYVTKNFNPHRCSKKMMVDWENISNCAKVMTLFVFGSIEKLLAGRWGETTSQPGRGKDSCSQVIDACSWGSFSGLRLSSILDILRTSRQFWFLKIFCLPKL